MSALDKYLFDAADLPAALPRGMEMSLVPLRDLTSSECRAFGLPQLLKGNADLVPCTREVRSA